MKLQDVILKAMAKKTSWLDAAEIIGVCDRTSHILATKVNRALVKRL